jgi:hypothetical protein
MVQPFYGAGGDVIHQAQDLRNVNQKVEPGGEKVPGMGGLQGRLSWL